MEEEEEEEEEEERHRCFHFHKVVYSNINYVKCVKFIPLHVSFTLKSNSNKTALKSVYF